MEFRKWEEYSEEEKSIILNHWFYYYYGDMYVTLKEIVAFRNLVETRKEDIFNHIITNLLCRGTMKNRALVASMREDRVDELFSHSFKMDAIGDELREKVVKTRQYLVNEMLRTLLFPELTEANDFQVIIEDNPKNGKGR